MFPTSHLLPFQLRVTRNRGSRSVAVATGVPWASTTGTAFWSASVMTLAVSPLSVSVVTLVIRKGGSS